FGDRANYRAWSRVWWAQQNKLYVGSNRNFGCATDLALHVGDPSVVPYPPVNPATICPQNPAEIPLQEEIWSWDPATKAWTRVYQSPNTVPMANYPGLFAPQYIAFRTATIYSDTQGRQTMYFGDINAQCLGYGTVPAARLMYALDGVNWTAVPQDTGTSMANIGGASKRELKKHNNQLLVINKSMQDNGPIITSLPGHDPNEGNDAWATVSPPNLAFYDLDAFNGWLYVTVLDTAT